MRLRRGSSAPLELFLWSRAAIWIATLLAVLVVGGMSRGPNGTPATAANSPHDVGWAVDLWGRWDGGWYLRIAEHGYVMPHTTTAFYPLYPLLMRAVGWVLGGHDLLAGIVVSLAACCVAFVLLYRLTTDLAGVDTANRTVVALALFPTALFLGAVYS